MSRACAVLACLLAAAGAWLWSSSQPVNGFDALFYRAWDEVWGEGTPASRPWLLEAGEAPPTRREARRSVERLYPEVAYAMLHPEEVSAHFHASPIQPLDFAVLLDAVRKGGVSHLGVSSPFGWKSSCEPLVQETLRRQMQAFCSCVLGLRARTASRPEFTPTELAGGALDPARIEGSIAFLPSANASLPHALSNWSGSFAPWALDWVEGEALMREGRTGKASYPLLVRWHGDIYPTLPLRLALLAEGVAPGDVSVEIGSHIAWAEKRLPLDSYGRTTLEDGCRTRRTTLGELMDGRGRQAPSRAKEGGFLLLCEPVASLPGEEERTEWVAATLSQLACRETARTEWVQHTVAGRPLYRVHESPWALLMAGGVGLLYLLLAPRWSRAAHFGADVLLLLLGGIALAKVVDAGGWLPVAPWAAAWAVLWVGGRLLRLGRTRRRR